MEESYRNVHMCKLRRFGNRSGTLRAPIVSEVQFPPEINEEGVKKERKTFKEVKVCGKLLMIRSVCVKCSQTRKCVPSSFLSILSNQIRQASHQEWIIIHVHVM